MKRAIKKNPGKSDRKISKAKVGRRSLYNPKLGTGNARRAKYGRFSCHPLFLAVQKIKRATVLLQRFLEISKNHGVALSEYEEGRPSPELKGIIEIDDFEPPRITSVITGENSSPMADVVNQLANGLSVLQGEASKLNGRGDKLRFAEVIAASLAQEAPIDNDVFLVCMRAEKLTRMMGERPSRAELRKAVEKYDHLRFSDQRWKRMMKGTGLNVQLPTARQKRQGVTLRR